jgi:hypothetical protein
MVVNPLALTADSDRQGVGREHPEHKLQTINGFQQQGIGKAGQMPKPKPSQRIPTN